jgi:hypothetical protein
MDAMDTYEVVIESQERFTNEDGETKFGPVRKANVTIEARSETEAAVIARTYRTAYNNVTVSKI